MNLTRLFLILLLFLAFSVGANSQESPKAVLIDEFGSIGCEDLSGRLDVFLNELNSKPNSKGYVVISTNPDVAARLAWRERFIDGYARYRRFDENRILIVRGILQEPIQTQMWVIPQGTRFTTQLQSEHRYDLTTSLKKTKFYSDFDDGGPCYTNPPFRILSKYLKANPDLNANIAIGSTSSKSFRKTKEEIIKSFRKDYGTGPSQLRFFWVRTQYEPEIFELWLIRRRAR